jgi:hypothetical protein
VRDAGVEASATWAVLLWLAGAVSCMPSVASWISHATHAIATVWVSAVRCRGTSEGELWQLAHYGDGRRVR